jgi:hypothetical protein
MRGKDKDSSIDDAEIERIVRLARQCGMIGIMSLDGRICAGVINFRAGENYFLETLAHDPLYNEYRLGTLCCYLTICECIARGGNEYHFLWGHYDYKSRLLGVARDLDHVTIYRSLLQMVLRADTVLLNMANSRVRRAKVWLHNAERAESPRLPARLAIHCRDQVRELRRYASGLRVRSK